MWARVILISVLLHHFSTCFCSLFVHDICICCICIYAPGVGGPLGAPWLESYLDRDCDRDFAAEFLFAASLSMIHLSQLAEDIVIHSSQPFGFLQLADAYKEKPGQL